MSLGTTEMTTKFATEHEHSSAHLKRSAAYLLYRKQSNVTQLLTGTHQKEVRKRRQVMERIIAVVKLIGKRGLSYRGSNEEAAYALDDDEM